MRTATRSVPLVESTPGRYTASWSAVGRAFRSTSCNSTPGIFPDGTYTIRVFDSASQLVHQASTVRLTGVSQVTRTPDHFAPAAGETTTVTVTAAAGLNLEARFGNSQAAVRTIARTGAATTYTAVWDGRDAGGQLAPTATYSIVVGPVGSALRYVPSTSVQLSVAITSVTAAADPFIPTGSNTTTITVEGTPGQSGLKVGFSGPRTYENCDPLVPLVESTPGRYTASWSAVGRAFLSTSCSSTPGIFPDGTYTIRVFDSASQLVHQASTVRLTGVSQVTRTPDHFAPAAGETTTVTVTAAAGLNLEARFGNSQAAVRTIALTGAATTYTAVWDGRDAGGQLAPTATYSISSSDPWAARSATCRPHRCSCRSRSPP